MSDAAAIPRNVLWGLAVGIAVGVAGLWVTPEQTANFYAAAVQVVPVFLVALALERSLVDTLGSETGVVGEELARVRSDHTPPSSTTRTYFGIESELNQLPRQSITRQEFERLSRRYKHTSDAEIWRSLASEEEPNHRQLETIIEVLVYRRLARSTIQAWTQRPAVTASELVEEWAQLFDKFARRATERASDEIRFQATERYRRTLAEQRRSVLFSITVLAAAEGLGFIGLLSPGRPYSGLFAVTGGFVAASFVAVTMGAVRQLLERPLDVQSAGLDWSDEPA